MNPGSLVSISANVAATPVQAPQASTAPVQVLAEGTRATYLGDLTAASGVSLARILIATQSGPSEYLVARTAVTPVPPPPQPVAKGPIQRWIVTRLTGSEPAVHRVLYSRVTPWVIAPLMLLELWLCLRLLTVRPYLEYHYFPSTDLAHMRTAFDAVNNDTLQRLREAEELVRIGWPQRDEPYRPLEATTLARVQSGLDLARQINATRPDSANSLVRVGFRKVPPGETPNPHDLATNMRVERPWLLAELAFARAVVAQRRIATASAQDDAPAPAKKEADGKDTDPKPSSTDPGTTSDAPNATPPVASTNGASGTSTTDGANTDKNKPVRSCECEQESEPVMEVSQLLFAGSIDEIRHPRRRLECRIDALLDSLTPAERTEARRLAATYAEKDVPGFWSQSDFGVFYVSACLGAIGALVQGLMSLVMYTGNRRFMPSWSLFYILRPVVAAGIASGFCLIIKGGFLDVGNNGSTGQVSYFAFAAVSLLVGLFVGEAMEKLKMVAAAFLHGNEHRDTLGDRAPLVEQATLSADDAGRARARLVLTGVNLLADSTVFLDGSSQEVASISFAAGALTVDLRQPLAPGRKLTIVILNPPPQAGVSRPFVLKG